MLAVVRSVLKRAGDRAEAALAQGLDPFDALTRFVLSAADERIGATCVILDGAYDPEGLLSTLPAIAKEESRELL